MSAPEPLKLTTEEARQAYEKAAAELDRICQGPRHGFRMQIPAHPDDSDLVLGEALGALKQLIAERDEAAELRAENERLRADLFEYVLDGFVQGAHRQEDGGYHTGGISTYRDLGNWLVEHAHWTRRPGGRGRNQVYDPPKADAASEGQS